MSCHVIILWLLSVNDFSVLSFRCLRSLTISSRVNLCLPFVFLALRSRQSIYLPFDLPSALFPSRLFLTILLGFQLSFILSMWHGHFVLPIAGLGTLVQCIWQCQFAFVEMEILKHVEEPPKSQKHTKTSGDPSYTSKVENEDGGGTGQESETAKTRSKADHGSKTECLDEKKPFGEEVSRTKVAAKKQTNKSKKVEVEESSESDSDSNSDNSSSSESDSSEASSSETSESEKGIKNVTKKQPTSQASLPDEGPRDKERDQSRRRNEEEMRTVRQESSSSRSRKEADRKKLETKEEERRLSKKKRSRNSSDGEAEGLGQSEKRRHVSQSDDKHSRHRLEEPRTVSRQTERTDDKDRSRRHKDSSQNHKKCSQKQDDRAKSDDSDRHDASYDYLSRTCEQDYERSAKSRHKRSRHSQSSHSSTERPSRRRRDRTPDRRRSTHGQVSSSSGKDRGRHKSANNRSGKKERAKHRSRSRSR